MIQLRFSSYLIFNSVFNRLNVSPLISFQIKRNIYPPKWGVRVDKNWGEGRGVKEIDHHTCFDRGSLQVITRLAYRSVHLLSRYASKRPTETFSAAARGEMEATRNVCILKSNTHTHTQTGDTSRAHGEWQIGQWERVIAGKQCAPHSTNWADGGYERLQLAKTLGGYEVPLETRRYGIIKSAFHIHH